MPGPVIPDHLATVCHCCPWKGRNTPDVLKQFQLSSGLATLDLSAAFYAVGHQPNMVGVGISGITTTDYNNISLQWGNIVIRVAVISLFSDNSESPEWYKVIIIFIPGHPHYQQCFQSSSCIPTIFNRNHTATFPQFITDAILET